LLQPSLKLVRWLPAESGLAAIIFLWGFMWNARALDTRRRPAARFGAGSVCI
jgi:hypothetical protein